MDAPQVYKINTANWSLFKETLNKNITLKNLNNCSTEKLEQATKEWMETVKEAIDKAIPKSNHKFIHQLKSSPEIRNLEKQFKVRKQNALTNG